MELQYIGILSDNDAFVHLCGYVESGTISLGLSLAMLLHAAASTDALLNAVYVCGVESDKLLEVKYNTIYLSFPVGYVIIGSSVLHQPFCWQKSGDSQGDLEKILRLGF